MQLHHLSVSGTETNLQSAYMEPRVHKLLMEHCCIADIRNAAVAMCSGTNTMDWYLVVIASTLLAN